MSEGRRQATRYKNPPIDEALCDFQFAPGEPWDPTLIGLIYTGLRRRFPERRTVPRVEASLTEGNIHFRGNLSSTMYTQFINKQRTEIVAVGPDQITISRVKQYPGWLKFKPLVSDMLDRYVDIARPQGFSRIGLRYLNRIVIPHQSVELPQYFDFFPYIGERFPSSTFGGFAILVNFSYHDGRDILKVQLDVFVQVDPKERDPDASYFDLDLDYVLTRPGGVRLNEAMEWVEEAHTTIGAAFEAVIQDPLRALFNGDQP